MQRKINKWAEVDWITIILYLFLVVIGWISIYSSVYNEEEGKILDLSERYGKQLILISGALIIALVVVITDSRFYSFFAYFIYLFFIFLLITVLLFGNEIHGAKSWFELGRFRLQPAEFAKLGAALALSRYVSSNNFNINKPKNIFGSLAIILIPALLVFFQPDTGTALVFLALILVLYREGLSGGILLLGGFMIILFILTLIIDEMSIVIGLLTFWYLMFFIIDRNIKRFLIAALIYISLAFIFS